MFIHTRSWRMGRVALASIAALALLSLLPLIKPAPAQAAVDGATVTSSVYQDAVGPADGQVDRIVWTFNDTLTSCVYEAGDWSVTTAGTVNVTAVTGIDCDIGQPYLYIFVTADADITGGETNPIIQYSNVGTAGSILTDDWGAYGTRSWTAADDAGPLLYAAETGDDDPTNGLIDNVTVYFTEGLPAGTIGVNHFSVVDDVYGTYTVNWVTHSDGDDWAEVWFDETHNAEYGDTDSIPDVSTILTYNDKAPYFNNSTPATVTATDGAHPVICSSEHCNTRDARYFTDSNNDGNVDTARVIFSEPVTDVNPGDALDGNEVSFYNANHEYSLVYAPPGSGDVIVASQNGRDVVFSFVIPAGRWFPDATDDGTTGDDWYIEFNQSAADSIWDSSRNRVYDTNETDIELPDRAPPAFGYAYSNDNDHDGRLDGFFVEMSEPIDEDSLAAGDVAIDGFTVTGLMRNNFDEDYSRLALFAAVYEEVGNWNTGATPDIEVAAGGSLADTADSPNELNFGMDGAVSVETNDDAHPVVAYTSPGDGGSLRPETASVIVKFSEIIPAMHREYPQDIQFDPALPGEWQIDTDDSRGYSVMTFMHDGWEVGTEVTVTIEAAMDGTVYDASRNVLCEATGEDAFCNGDHGNYQFTFTARARSGGGGSVSSTTTSTTPTIDLTDPTASESLTAGEAVNVAWTHGGSGISQVELRYSTDGGVTTTLIASNLSTTSPYSWTVPSTLSGSVKLILIGQDSGKSNLATDEVSVTVSAVSTPTEEEQNADQEAADAAAGITTDADGHRVAPGTGTYGSSPFDGSSEEISEVASGWFIRSYNYDTVYYVSDGLARRPFWSATAFMTWAPTGWNDVVWVTDATLATLTLGDVMLPKPGVVLVKISSDPKVYLAEYGETSADPYLLRWVSTETVASTMFGAAWAGYIIDIESTVMGHYDLGSDVTFAETVDKSIMRTRALLASMVAGT